MPSLLKETRARACATEFAETLYEEAEPDESVRSLLDHDSAWFYPLVCDNFFDGGNTPLIHQACSDIANEMAKLKNDEVFMRSLSVGKAQRAWANA